MMPLVFLLLKSLRVQLMLHLAGFTQADSTPAPTCLLFRSIPRLPMGQYLVLLPFHSLFAFVFFVVQVCGGGEIGSFGFGSSET